MAARFFDDQLLAGIRCFKARLDYEAIGGALTAQGHNDALVFAQGHNSNGHFDTGSNIRIGVSLGTKPFIR